MHILKGVLLILSTALAKLAVQLSLETAIATEQAGHPMSGHLAEMASVNLTMGTVQQLISENVVMRPPVKGSQHATLLWGGPNGPPHQVHQDVSLIDWISDTRSQGCTELHSLM